MELSSIIEMIDEIDPIINNTYVTEIFNDILVSFGIVINNTTINQDPTDLSDILARLEALEEADYITSSQLEDELNSVISELISNDGSTIQIGDQCVELIIERQGGSSSPINDVFLTLVNCQ